MTVLVQVHRPEHKAIMVPTEVKRPVQNGNEPESSRLLAATTDSPSSKIGSIFLRSTLARPSITATLRESQLLAVLRWPLMRKHRGLTLLLDNVRTRVSLDLAVIPSKKSSAVCRGNPLECRPVRASTAFRPNNTYNSERPRLLSTRTHEAPLVKQWPKLKQDVPSTLGGGALSAC